MGKILIIFSNVLFSNIHYFLNVLSALVGVQHLCDPCSCQLSDPLVLLMLCTAARAQLEFQVSSFASSARSEVCPVLTCEFSNPLRKLLKANKSGSREER